MSQSIGLINASNISPSEVTERVSETFPSTLIHTARTDRKSDMDGGSSFSQVDGNATSAEPVDHEPVAVVPSSKRSAETHRVLPAVRKSRRLELKREEKPECPSAFGKVSPVKPVTSAEQGLPTTSSSQRRKASHPIVVASSAVPGHPLVRAKKGRLSATSTLEPARPPKSADKARKKGVGDNKIRKQAPHTNLTLKRKRQHHGSAVGSEPQSTDVFDFPASPAKRRKNKYVSKSDQPNWLHTQFGTEGSSGVKSNRDASDQDGISYEQTDGERQDNRPMQPFRIAEAVRETERSETIAGNTNLVHIEIHGHRPEKTINVATTTTSTGSPNDPALATAEKDMQHEQHPTHLLQRERNLLPSEKIGGNLQEPPQKDSLSKATMIDPVESRDSGGLPQIHADSEIAFETAQDAGQGGHPTDHQNHSIGPTGATSKDTKYVKRVIDPRSTPRHRPAQRGFVTGPDTSDDLVDEVQAMKSSIINFSRGGPRNQGRLLITGTPGTTSSAIKSAQHYGERAARGTKSKSKTLAVQKRDRCSRTKDKSSSSVFLDNVDSQIVTGRAAEPSTVDSQPDYPTLSLQRANLVDDLHEGAGPVPSSPLQARSKSGNARLLSQHVPSKQATKHLRKPKMKQRQTADTNILEQLGGEENFADPPSPKHLGASIVEDRPLSTDVHEITRPSPKTAEQQGSAQLVSHKATHLSRPGSPLRSDNRHNETRTTSNLINRRVSKPYLVHSIEPSRVITGLTTLHHVVEPDTIEDDLLASPNGHNSSESPFMQRLHRLMRQSEEADGPVALEQAAVIQPVAGAIANSNDNQQNPQKNPPERCDVGVQQGTESWLNELTPELRSVYEELQDANKRIVLELAKSAHLVERKLDQYHTDALGMTKLLETYKAKHQGEADRRRASAIKAWGEVRAERVQRMNEEIEQPIVA